MISLFTGAGGLDLGLEAAGFDTMVAVEMDNDAVRTLRHNRNWSIIQGDIHTRRASSRNILSAAGLQVGEATLLCGGPPCQPFSKSGYWKTGDSKRLNDPRAKTLDAYLRVLRQTLPVMFLLENVPGMAFNDKSEGLQLLRHEITKINKGRGTNYSFAAQQLNAAEFGVPQLRERVFVIGHRDGKVFQYPRPTHGLPPRRKWDDESDTAADYATPAGLKAAATAWDAIGHLDEENDPDLALRGKWAGLLRSIPEGRNYLYHTDRGRGLPIFGWRTRYWSMLLKLAKNRPSWTLTAYPGPAIGPFHWNSRRLSVRELAALQTFPADFEILGEIQAAHKQLGNAVPSALAEILGRAMAQQFLHRAYDMAPTLCPPSRGRAPAPTTPDSVARRYRLLVGDHAPHPGPGLGPGALREEATSRHVTS